jgi:hypothetical protein
MLTRRVLFRSAFCPYAGKPLVAAVTLAIVLEIITLHLHSLLGQGEAKVYAVEVDASGESGEMRLTDLPFIIQNASGAFAEI